MDAFDATTSGGRWLRWRIALPLDTLCIASFVVVGGSAHSAYGGLAWFLSVVWPLLAGWLTAALVFRLYASPTRTWLRLGATSLVGIAIGLIVRALVTHREAPAAFIGVANAFISLSALGWRLVWLRTHARR